ncbi:MAG: response regulator [Pseudomonadota bacterium]
MLLKKLVIAEDDDAIAHLVAASLGDAGFLCLRARDGEEALTLIRRELPDVLVLDVMMPKLDGMQVCKRIKSDVLLSRVPILMLTSLAGVDDRVAGLNAGADDYLPKPFDLRELAARVKALIRQSRRERDRNPVTNLPGNEAVEDIASEWLDKKEPFSLLYVDIENFRTYSDIYGYRKSETVVDKTGKLLLQRCKAAADEIPFLGHLGGDDFVIIGTSQAAEVLCESLPDAFQEMTASVYSDKDRERGSVSLTDSDGGQREVHLMNLSVARVDVKPGQYATTEELANEVTRVKAATRNWTHSGLMVIQPQEKK